MSPIAYKANTISMNKYGLTLIRFDFRATLVDRENVGLGGEQIP